jgi:hypothetical protein
MLVPGGRSPGLAITCGIGVAGASAGDWVEAQANVGVAL